MNERQIHHDEEQPCYVISVAARMVGVHPRFDRKGHDLVEDVPVPVEDAAFGGEVEVLTIAGKRVAMKVPAMTQNGRQIKLKGLGMPSLTGKGKGDLVARVRLVIPDDLSDDERALFEELREMRKNGHKRAK